MNERIKSFEPGDIISISGDHQFNAFKGVVIEDVMTWKTKIKIIWIIIKTKGGRNV